MGKHLSHCFWLLVPILVWNIVFISHLPASYARDVFWKDISPFIGTTENIARIVIFILPVLMQFSLKTPVQRAGLGIYLLGLVLYFASWILQMYFPQSGWSQSPWGYAAPAYTTIVFFVGISMIGRTSFVALPHISIIYIVLSVIFVAFHTIATWYFKGCNRSQLRGYGIRSFLSMTYVIAWHEPNHQICGKKIP